MSPIDSWIARSKERGKLLVFVQVLSACGLLTSSLESFHIWYIECP